MRIGFQSASLWVYSCGCAEGCRIGRQRKADDEGGSFGIKIVVTNNFAPVFADDAIADAQSQSGSLANVFGREKGIEDAVGVGDAGTVIAERDFDVAAAARAHDFDAGGMAAFADRVIGIVDDVEKNLLQLMRIADDFGQGLIQALQYLNAVTDEVVRTELHGAVEDGIQLHRLAARRHLARKAEQVLHNLLGALGFLENDSQIAARTFGKLGIFHEQIGESKNGGERIVDLVSDSGDQLSHGRHFFGVHELGAKQRGVGDVGHHDDNTAHFAVLVADRAEIDGELSAGAVPANQWKIEVVDLLTAGDRGEGLAGGVAERSGTEVGKGVADDVVLLKTEPAPAPVGVTDDAFGVGDENETLGVTEDFAGKVALPLQLGLGLAEAGDVEHEPPVLHDISSLRQS